MNFEEWFAQFESAHESFDEKQFVLVKSMCRAAWANGKIEQAEEDGKMVLKILTKKVVV